MPGKREASSCSLPIPGANLEGIVVGIRKERL